MADNETLLEPQPSTSSANDNVQGYRVTIEPALAATFFAQYLTDAVLTQLYLKQCCTVELQMNSSVCDALGTDSAEGHWAEAHVQPFAADYLMWKLMLQSVIPAVLSLFIGPWTDTHGRKPVLLFSVAGATLMYCTYLVLAYLPNLHPAYLLVAVVPMSCLGGYVNLISAAFCYISDIGHPDQRSLRLGILEAFICMGILVGLSSSAHIFAAAESAFGYGYMTIFSVAAGSCFLSVIYLAFFVRESVNVTQRNMGICGLLNATLPMEMFRTCFMRRPEHRRVVIWCCMVVLASSILVLEGETQVSFLFTRLQFSWTLRQFNVFSAAFMLISTFGILFGVWIVPTYLHASDITITLLSFGTSIVQCLLIVAARPDQAYFMYIGGSIGFLRGVTAPFIRSIMSNTVDDKDLGKVFALTASLEALMPIAASPLYVGVYDVTMLVLPSSFFLLTAAIFSLNICLVVTIAVIQTRYRQPNLDDQHPIAT